MRIHGDLQVFGRGFMRLWERIHGDSKDYGREFARICETLGEDLQGFMGIHKTLRQDL